jgi:peptide deformylase
MPWGIEPGWDRAATRFKTIREQGFRHLRSRNNRTVMNISEILENYSVEIATFENHYDWVKAKAREIDLKTEMHLAVILDKIMHYFRDLNKYAGVSSNNIYWTLTEIPIRVMLIPIAQREYQTIINPEYLELAGKEINNVEACGSVPDNNNYVVKRRPYVLLYGYTLEKNIIELEYGSRDYDAGEDPVISSYHHREWVIQHEMDHLDGTTIKDIGALFDFNSLIL